MYQIREVGYGVEIPRSFAVVLSVDIGGTNSNFGVFKQDDSTTTLVVSLHIKSQEISDFAQAVKQVVDYLREKYSLTVSTAIIAAAGVVSANKDFCKPTNLPFVIDARQIEQATAISCVYIVNDFDVIGYGLEGINPKDIVCVKRGLDNPHANRAIVGAGTGLGKSILVWDTHAQGYVPIASEGGHADFPAYTTHEMQLVYFVQQIERMVCPVSWEDLLSGRGIERIYHFFCHGGGKKASLEEKTECLCSNGPHPDQIFARQLADRSSKLTLELYTILYARCAKNFALEALALGGLYIAGGIAAKNLSLFQQQLFIDEFLKCGKQARLLHDIPVYVITDYNVSLYGGIIYLRKQGLC